MYQYFKLHQMRQIQKLAMKKRSVLPNDLMTNKPSDINVRYNIHSDANNINLPGTMWGLHIDYSEKKNILYMVFTHISFYNDKFIIFITSKLAKVFIRQKETHIEEYIEKRVDIENLRVKLIC
ncbi:THAP-type domain-containing protein [Aphis craccivora]|uniref:THAP-type domain-containing protein n=1 Tax=Aphis craccivora TaxID=307492 RepID=A0A6G0XSY3_APHCR|nr:THAP-type domain-containing protein [Aphis craccivora]